MTIKIIKDEEGHSYPVASDGCITIFESATHNGIPFRLDAYKGDADWGKQYEWKADGFSPATIIHPAEWVDLAEGESDTLLQARIDGLMAARREIELYLLRLVENKRPVTNELLDELTVKYGYTFIALRGQPE